MIKAAVNNEEHFDAIVTRFKNDLNLYLMTQDGGLSPHVILGVALQLATETVDATRGHINRVGLMDYIFRFTREIAGSIEDRRFDGDATDTTPPRVKRLT